MTGLSRRPGHLRMAAAVGPLRLVGALAVIMLLVLPGVAQASTPPRTLSLTTGHGPQGGSSIELLARLAQPSGPAGTNAKSLSGVTVTFSIHLQEFSGSPLLVLGSATTDAKGAATFAYQPTWTGPQHLVAVATNQAGLTLASGATELTAKAAEHPFAGTVEAVRPDGTIGQVVVGVLLAIIALVWIVLIAVVVRVHRGVTPSMQPPR